jgi:ABC-type polysaccharide/polyol phosphate transport system ATPase subunit
MASHELGEMRNVCDEILVLDEGQVITKAEPQQAIEQYYDLMRKRTAEREEELSAGGIQNH